MVPMTNTNTWGHNMTPMWAWDISDKSNCANLTENFSLCSLDSLSREKIRETACRLIRLNKFHLVGFLPSLLQKYFC